jgi:hypothetical protein
VTWTRGSKGETMLWLLFFLLPVFGGVAFIIIDLRRARLEAYDDDADAR